MKLTVIYRSPVPTRRELVQLYATRALIGAFLCAVLVGMFGWILGLWLMIMLYVGVFTAAYTSQSLRPQPCMYCGSRRHVGPLVLPGRPWPRGLRWLLPPRYDQDWVCNQHFIRWIEDHAAVIALLES